MEHTVWVSGASSQLGVFLLPRLRAAGFRVLALSRRAPRPPLAVADGVTWTRPDDGAAPGPEFLISCGPLDLARRLLADGPGLRRVVAFSSSSVLSKADSGDRVERGRMTAMGGLEAELAAACAERRLPLLLLRPTLIYGCGLDRNVSLLAAAARRLGFIPVAGRAGGLRQPVHADDLADLAVRALTAAAPLDLVSPACGGSTLSYREMAHRIVAALPRRARVLPLPEWLLAGLAPPLSRLFGWPGLTAEMVRRQNRDLVFDDSALRRALAWSPRPFEPIPADFEVPPYARSLQLPDPQS
jgi:nucleoside-diphosphate-sugar epimerase